MGTKILNRKSVLYFCLLIKTQQNTEVSYFCKLNFPKGYGQIFPTVIVGKRFLVLNQSNTGNQLIWL
jgi:hypothetical protein